MVIAEILAAVGGAQFAYQLAQDYSKTCSFYRKYNNYIWKQSASLDPEMFFEGRFKYYKDYYYPRDEDRDIGDSINNQKNVLILGRPLAGKSRAVFEVLKKFEKNCFVLKPRPVDIEIESYTFPKLPGNMKKVMFLDDLHIFAEKENFDYLFEVARKNKLIIVATCRSGFDYDLLEKRLPPNLTIESIFDKVVTYDKVPESQAQLIASNLDINWEEAEFDGTIGSLIMKLGPMKTRYKELSQNETDILRILRRLYCAGISEEGQLFFVDTIETFAKAKGIISNTNDLNNLLASLISKEFIENPMENVYQVEEIYLERVIDFGVKTQRISILKDVSAIFSGDLKVLRKVGSKALSLSLIRLEKSNYARIAIQVYEEVLKFKTLDVLSTDWAQVQNDLGNAYCEVALVEKKEANLLAAINAYNQALKVFTPTKLPTDHAIIQNNLGSAYCELSLVKCRSVDLLNNAIYAFEKALVIFKPDYLPIAYAGTQNNLGIAYQELALVDNKKVNLLNAINAYNEALKFRTADKLPVDYAATQNNLGNAYSILFSVDNNKINLLGAISAYNEALKFRTADKLPVDYAATQNNLGNAYLRLSSIEIKKINLLNAINAYNEALKYRTPDKLPVYYAETQYSLGNAYRNLANVEERNKNHSNAIKAYENALNIYSPEEFPMEFDIVSRNLMRLLN